ncbi:hypothetical protein SprV_0802567300 [Sparganum proliferum]
MRANICSCATGLLRQRKHHQALPIEEEKALRSVKTEDKIFIMSADKGGTTVIMDKADYVNKVNQIFDDREAYGPHAVDPTKKQAAAIKKKENEPVRLKLISPDNSRSMALCYPRVCQPSAASNMPELPMRIPRTNWYRWTPPDPMHYQPDNTYLLILSSLPQTPCRPPPSSSPITLSLPRRHHSSCLNLCIDRSGQHYHEDFTHSPTDRTTSDVLSRSNINISTSSNVDSVHTCPPCDRTFTSQTNLVDR